ncbi:hypothetical protein [Bradyrhizobium sp. SZCCHNS3051]|uniref:hypothetical protein n=1 Tax=Bradyrhizobium sp. SZCCHNS3051 TaxID=3057320 RepID=UPI0029163D10|nr:hypothetical protein [Bradyrhizobium sp. SZCCHNS3051]
MTRRVPIQLAVLIGLDVNIEPAFTLMDRPVGQDIFTRMSFKKVATPLLIYVLAQLREVHRLPRDRLGVDQASQMIVEPSHDPVHLGCDQLGRTAHGVHQDQDLRGFLLREPFENFSFPPVLLAELLRRLPEALRALEYDGQPLGDKFEPLAVV